MSPHDFAAAADALTLDSLRSRSGTKWSSTCPDVLPAWVADLDLPLAPAVLTALADALSRQDLGYPDDVGPELAQAWAAWSERRYGPAPDIRYVSQHADVVSALSAVVELLTTPGEPVLVPVPAYPPFVLGATALGRPPVQVPLAADGTGRYAFDLDAVAAAMRAGARVVLLCSPHNPTGRAFSARELAALADVVLRHGGWLVSDEVHADLVLPGARHVPTASLGAEVAARTVTLAAASKAFGVTGLKAALVASPDADLHERLVNLRHGRGGLPGILGVIAAIAAWREGAGWLDAAVSYLGERRAQLAEAVAGWPGVRYRPHEATYLGWLDLRGTDLATDPAGELLRTARVRLSPGETFGAPGFVRLNTALPMPILADVLDRLSGVLSPAGLRAQRGEDGRDASA